MLDIRWIRENPADFDAAMARRGLTTPSKRVLKLDEARRAIATQLQELQNQRNVISKEIGTRKSKGEDAAELFTQMQEIGPKVKQLEEEQRKADEALDQVLFSFPNVMAADVPEGESDEDNVEISRHGTPRSSLQTPHYELGENLEMLDFETAQKLAGARFVWKQGDIARLGRAASNFMLDHLIKEGFLEVSPPYLVNDATVHGTGQLEKFEEDQFKTTDGRWLIPTAEVVLTNYGQNRIFKEEDLPILFCANTPSFRKEAGSAGRDTRGMVRLHQFHKVEMVALTTPKQSAEIHEKMLACEESLLQALGLPYRKMLLCSGDTGFGSEKTYDMEVWLPGQQTYREISSCSNCGAFQARRMKARYKNSQGQTEPIHTLNGSALPIERTLVAIMENYQTEDGSIEVPEVLQPYMGGQKIIKKAK